MLVNGSRGVVTNMLSREDVKQRLRASITAMRGGAAPTDDLAGKGISDALTIQQRRLQRVEECTGSDFIPVVRFRNGREVVVVCLAS